jgi:uncharacterized protein YdiU (UPF0061 family)
LVPEIGQLAVLRKTREDRQLEFDRLSERFTRQVKAAKDAIRAKRRTEEDRKETEEWRYKFWVRRQEEEEEQREGEFPLRIRPPIHKPGAFAQEKDVEPRGQRVNAKCGSILVPVGAEPRLGFGYLGDL